MKQTVFCPICGNPIVIEVANGTVSVVSHNHANDCGVNNPGLSTRQRARLEALIIATAKGELSGRYFAMENGGSTQIHTVKNGVPTPVSESELDSIEKSLYVNGYVRNTRLFRRFVLAQMMTALAYRHGFNDWLRAKGYRYSWRMAIEELRVLDILRISDPESYTERKRFFDRVTIESMAESYIAQLEKYVDNLPTRRCKGRAYKHIGSRNIYSNEIDAKVFSPLKSALDYIKSCPEGKLHSAAKNFFARIPVFMKGLEMSSLFIDAYKGEGAYYSLKNLIMFHGCVVRDKAGDKKTMYESLDEINKVADEFMPQGRGYVLLGMLKSVMKDNGFDYKSRMEQLGVSDK